MSKIAVYVNANSDLCDFFESDRFLIFDKGAQGWKTIDETIFERVVPGSPAETRKAAARLLPLVEDCAVVAGAGLYGIPFAVFDKAGKAIFEIREISDEIFDEILRDIETGDATAAIREKIIREARPVETDTPGVYVLDLNALQSECPEASSKMAMADFLENTPFLELRLICKHIPPWIENSGRYDIQIMDDADAIKAIITKRC
jgi:hypothetical protein